MLKQVLIKEGLSKRESEVAELVTKGLSNKEVADQLYVTEKTVKFHLTNIYKKMDLRSRAQLIVWCLPKMNFAEEARTNTTNPSPAATGEPKTAETTIPAGYTTVSDPTPFDKGQGSDMGSSF